MHQVHFFFPKTQAFGLKETAYLKNVSRNLNRGTTLGMVSYRMGCGLTIQSGLLMSFEYSMLAE